MLTRKLALLAALLVPVVTSAQGRKVRGEMEADRKGDFGAVPMGTKLSVRDVEDMNPVKLLVDKRKDLKLSDDQLKQIKEVDSKMKEKNQPLFKALDSVRSETRPRAVTPTEEDQTRIMIARHELAAVVSAIRASYDTTLKSAMPLLDEAQHKKADELLQKQAKEADDVLRERLGAGGGNGAVGGRRGRPPVGA